MFVFRVYLNYTPSNTFLNMIRRRKNGTLKLNSLKMLQCSGLCDVTGYKIDTFYVGVEEKYKFICKLFYLGKKKENIRWSNGEEEREENKRRIV